MDLLDGLWHLLNFFAPAFGVGGFAALLTKMLWRRDLKGVAWARLAAWAIAGAGAALIAGLVVMGRDGKMMTYGAMVLACALALWCAGWGPARR
jgi:hypothetical protein